MNKIFTLSMIKNEADIVETFVRYTMNFASKMFFVDNGCSDGSIEILKELIKEGFDIEIFSETQVFYEQFLIENKYIKKISDNYFYDFLIPLDIDEFLACDNCLLKQIDSLPVDKVIMIKWRTYCILSENEKTSNFFLDRITHVRLNEEKTFTKVILPYNLVKNNNLLVSMGHHDIESKSEIERMYFEEIYIAHFPVRSMEQIQLKIYQGIITQLMSSYHSVVAFHWRKIQKELRSGKFNLIKYSMEYALPLEQDLTMIDFVKNPFDYSWCKGNILPRYEILQNSDVLDNIYELLQMITIKNIIDESNKKVKIIIYGTGRSAENLFQFFNNEKYNLLAYVDSDPAKEYSKFNNKLVLAPDKIKYIHYDFIIIASRYYDEIYNTLLEIGIEKDKILDKFDLIRQQIND